MGTPTVPLSIEQKILAATEAVDQAVALFSPAAATAIAAGIAAEPIIKGLIQLFAEIFKHHATQPTAPPVVVSGK